MLCFSRARAEQFLWEIAQRDLVCRGVYHHLFDDVAQFPDILWVDRFLEFFVQVEIFLWYRNFYSYIFSNLIDYIR